MIKLINSCWIIHCHQGITSCVCQKQPMPPTKDVCLTVKLPSSFPPKQSRGGGCKKAVKNTWNNNSHKTMPIISLQQITYSKQPQPPAHLWASLKQNLAHFYLSPAPTFWWENKPLPLKPNGLLLAEVFWAVFLRKKKKEFYVFSGICGES